MDDSKNQNNDVFYLDFNTKQLESGDGLVRDDYKFTVISLVDQPTQPETLISWPVDNNIKFYVGGLTDQVEILKLDSNGDIYVKGELVQNNVAVVDALQAFLGYHAANSPLRKQLERVKSKALEFAENEQKLMMSSSIDRAEGVRLFVKEVLEGMLKEVL